MNYLFLALLFLMPSIAVADPVFDEQPEQKSLTDRLNAGDVRNLANEAMGRMFVVAERELNRSGYAADATQLETEWQTIYKPLILGQVSDTGDHKPLSQWLADWYAKIEAELGVTLCEFLHLRDIFVLNFTLPVVFDPHTQTDWCFDQMQDHPDDTCEAEYRRHFAGTKYAGNDPYATTALHHGFAGVIAYWCTDLVCDAFSSGMAALVCGPAATVVEMAIEKYVAPAASDKIWTKNNG